MSQTKTSSSIKPGYHLLDDALYDELLGERGTPERESFEFELSLELLAEKIKQLRKTRSLTKSELGALIGVGKAQISKLERNAATLTVATFLAITRALGTSVNIRLDTEALQLPA